MTIMRVLHVFKTYFPETIGGIEQVIHQIIRGGVQHGVYAEVLAMTHGKNTSTLEYEGYLVHRCHTNIDIASTPFSITAISRFRDLADNFDIIHFHFPYPFADLLHLISKTNKPTVVTYHSDIVKQRFLLKLYMPLMRHFLGSVDRIVATSPNYLKSSDVLRHYADKTEVIPVGIDKSSYPVPSEEKLQFWKQKFGEQFFLFVGVIRYYKGLHILIEAARDINYPIVIVGAGPIEASLKAQVKKLDVDNVYFLGRLPEEDKVALFKLCNCVVFPSHLRSEAFGVSLLEGAMYGKPMISSEIGTGTTFINIDQETGIAIPPSDPVALHDAMSKMANNKKEALKMGKKAAERYQNMFTVEKMVLSYIELYSSLLNKKK